MHDERQTSGKRTRRNWMKLVSKNLKNNLIKKITRPLDCISCLRPKSGPNMTPGWNKTHYCIESCLQVIGGQRCCYRRDSVVGHNLSPFLLFGHGKREGVSLWFYDCDIDKLMHRFYDIDKLMNRCCDIELLAILPLGLFVLIIILFISTVRCSQSRP